MYGCGQAFTAVLETRYRNLERQIVQCALIHTVFIMQHISDNVSIFCNALCRQITKI